VVVAVDVHHDNPVVPRFVVIVNLVSRYPLIIRSLISFPFIIKSANLSCSRGAWPSTDSYLPCGSIVASIRRTRLRSTSLERPLLTGTTGSSGPVLRHMALQARASIPSYWLPANRRLSALPRNNELRVRGKRLPPISDRNGHETPDRGLHFR